MAIGTALVTATGAHAAGFAISDKSVSALGTGFAGQAVMAEDPSVIYNNPAGMVQLEGRRVSVGLHRIATTAAFTDGGSDTTGAGDNRADVEAYVPNFYYQQELGADLRAGVALFSPFGLGLKYDDGWMGRYHTLSSELRTISLSPAVAWRMTPALAVGASIDLQYLEASMSKAIDFGAFLHQPQLHDGTHHLTGESRSYGYTLGVTWALAEATQLGAVFHSGTHHRLTGRSTFDNVPAPLAGRFTDSGGGLTLNLPAMATLGAAHAIDARLTLLADYTWTGWSSYDEVRVSFDNGMADSVGTEEWRDASRYSLGARYRLNPVWLLRAGFSYDQTPVPDAQHRTPRMPDADRRWYNFGARWEPRREFSLDLAYSFMDAGEVPIDNTESTTHHTLKGTYRLSSSAMSVQGNWRF